MRPLRLLAGVLGTTVTFLAATATAAVVNLDARPTKRLVVRVANGVLGDLFQGKVTVERIGGLGLSGVSGVRVRVRDPEGVSVLFVDGVRVRARGLAAAASALFGKGPIRVRVDEVAVDHVDVALDADRSGQMRLRDAFLSPKATKPDTSGGKGRGVHVDAPSILLRHAWVHGPAIDADVAGLSANVVVDPAATEVGLAHVAFETRGMPRGVDPRGTVVAHARIPAEGELSASGAIDGAVAGVPMKATAKMDGSRVDAKLDVAHASGDRLRAVLGDTVAESADAELHAEAHGVLPRVDAGVRLRLGHGTVDVDGTVVTGPRTDVRVVLAARHLDAGALVTGAPPSDVGFDARAHANLGDERRGEIALDTLAGVVEGKAIPPARVRAGFAGDAAWAGLRVAHPDMPTEIEAALTADHVVDAVVRAEVPELSRLPGVDVHGAAKVRARGRVDLGTKALFARAEVDGTGLEQGGRRVGELRARASATGTVAAPLADAEIHATQLDLGGIALDRADASARVSKRETIVVTEPRASVVRGTEHVVATASHVTVGGGGSIHAAGITIDGVGEPLHAELDRDAKELRVQVDAPSIDLARASALAGRRDVRAGRLAMNGDVILAGGDLRGELHAKASGVAASRVEGATGRVDARFDGRNVDLDVQAGLGTAGHASIRTDGLVLSGPTTLPESWRRAHGRADLDADVSLDRITELVPADVLPLSELRGELVVRGAAWRPNPDVPPRAHVTAYTRGLTMAGKVPEEKPLPPGVRVKGVAPWRSQDFDVQLDARIDPEAETNEIAVRLHDRKGIVAALDAKFGDVLSHPDRIADVPISAKLVVPERKLAAMPSLVGVRNVGGSVGATLDVSGTPAKPEVLLVAHGKGVRAGWLPLHLATDEDVRLAYDGRTAHLDAKVRAEGRDVVVVASRLDVSSRDLVERRTPSWHASTRVDLDGLPLEAVDVLADRRVKGKASGHVELTGLHEDARVDVDLALEGLAVGRARYPRGRVKVTADASHIAATARLDQTDGWLSVQADAPIAWGAALAPSLDAARPVKASLAARAFRVAALSPFVQGPLNDLDGRLDADASATIGGGAQQVQGHLALRDGRLQVTALGEELRDLRADVALQPDGTIAVRDVFARGTEGELEATATVHTRGLALASADAEIHVPKPLDFALQGEPIGRVTGDVKVHAEPKGERFVIRTEIPELRAELPQSMKSGLQEMSPPANVRAGVYRSPRELVQLPLDREDLEKKTQPRTPSKGGTPIDVEVKLGEITVVRGNQVRVVLTGNPKVTVDGETRLSGQIQLERGRIDVQGKEFEIDHGTVTFEPDREPSNPTVVATATWTAQDGTKVYADFVGPVKTGKVNLRSEPARPKNEILALILFGTADGMNGAPPPPGRSPDGSTKAAVGIGGGFAAQGLTEALDDLAGIQATARIDTTQSDNPRPEVEVQIAKSISVAFGHVLGNPPITEPDKNLVTLDWRFRRNWSLETTFGDRGRATLDAIWQRRY